MLIRFFNGIVFLFVLSQVAFGADAGCCEKVPDLVCLYQDYCSCVAKVKCIRSGEQCQLSGFFVSDSGHMITSVVDGKDFLVQTSDGQWLNAEKIGDDAISSICSLKVDCGKKSVKYFPLMREYDWPIIGQRLVSLSCKLGGKVSPQEGFVTSFCDHYYGVEWPMTLIRSSLRMDAGDCGGAVLDTNGKLQGMLLHAIADSQETFFIPLWGLRKIFQDLLVFQRVRYCYVGLNTQAVFDNVRKEPCLKVLKVMPLSPADKAGFKEGDVLLKVNDRAIDSVESFKNFMFLSTPNDFCEVEILRGDKTVKLTLILGEKM